MGVLGSFLTQTAARALHVHEGVPHASASKPSCGHAGHPGCVDRRGSEHSDRDEKGTCELCLKLTLAKFSAMAGGSVVGLVLPPMVVATVEPTETQRAGGAWALRATSRGPPSLA